MPEARSSTASLHVVTDSLLFVPLLTWGCFKLYLSSKSINWVCTWKTVILPKNHVNFTILFNNSCWKWEKLTKKQQNIGEGRKPWQRGKKITLLGWNRLWYQKRESVIPALRPQRWLPDNFTHLLNLGPSISGNEGCFKWQPPCHLTACLEMFRCHIYSTRPMQSVTPKAVPIAGSRLWVTSTEVHGLRVLVNPPPTWPIPQHRQGRAQSCPPFWMTP